MKNFLTFLVLVFILFTTTACGGQNLLAQVSDNLTEYDISLNIDTQNMSVTAREEVSYLNTSESILTDIRFHLYPRAFDQGVHNPAVSSLQSAKAYPQGVDYGGINVESVRLGEQDLVPTYAGADNDILVVPLDSPLEPNSRVKISIGFTLDIPNVLHRFGYGDNTINLGNAYPIACVREQGDWRQEGYHYNGDPFYSDIANYTLTVTYPTDYTLATTGDQKTKTNTLTKTTTTTARAVRDFALVLSDKFSVLSEKSGDVEVNYYYFDDPSAQQNLQTSIDALECFSDKFYDYPYDTLSVVKADFVHGGMEYPCLVYIASDLDDIQYTNCIIHEIAHQWWYGLVGNDQYNEAWLDEPLAEMSTALFYKWHPKYNLRYADVISSAQDNMSLFLSVYREVLGEVDTSMNRPLNAYDTEAEYTYMQYVKGLLFYDNLLSSIGEAKLVKALNAYAHQYAFCNASGEELIACFESATKVKLNNFFSSWVEGKVILN